MTDHGVPGREATRLKTIASRQKWLFVGMQIGILLAIASGRLLGERYDVLAAILTIGLGLGAIGIFVYLSCFQRCPRCAGWIVIPKCPACGLKLGGARKSA